MNTGIKIHHNKAFIYEYEKSYLCIIKNWPLNIFQGHKIQMCLNWTTPK